MTGWSSGWAALALLAATPAAAQPADTNPWRQLTEGDVAAAYTLLTEDHPGAAPEAGDAAFRQRLEAAHDVARQRAREVSSVEGYAATMMGFANALGDKHIRARQLLIPVTLDWAGLLLARRGDQWVVRDEDGATDGAPLRSARLLACDGVTAERFAEQRLGGFRAIWSVPAQRIATAPWLLADDGNPFLRRPTRCTFSQNGAEREVALRWRTVRRAEVAPRMNALVRSGAPGFGVRRSGAGYWIALQSLSDQAIPVVDAVRTQAEEMRRAAFVVLDMRGNGGGNSIYGDQIAGLLLGAPATGAGESESCNPVWRTSARNLRQLAEIRAGAAQRMGADAALFWENQHRRATEARAAGRALSGPATCSPLGAPDAPRPVASTSGYRGRLVVLTDHLCFSSCLLVTDRWRRLGALHVGEATDAATRYFEVREERMPSGLSTFSTLQAMSPASPYQIGPFVPERLYEGDISDTAALEQWVASLVDADTTQ